MHSLFVQFQPFIETTLAQGNEFKMQTTVIDISKWIKMNSNAIPFHVQIRAKVIQLMVILFSAIKCLKLRRIMTQTNYLRHFISIHNKLTYPASSHITFLKNSMLMTLQTKLN